MINVIYSIKNIKNNNEYIGSARSFKKRIACHKKQLKANSHHSIYLQRAWIKYGEEYFEFSVLENVDLKENLIKREQFWIDNSQSKYNMCKVAGSSLGLKRRKESIDKMRMKKIGMKHSAEDNLRKSIMQGGKNHYNYGKTLSEKTKMKKSKSMKKFYKSNPHPNKGKKNILSKKGFLSMRNKLMKPVIQYNLVGKFIKEWKSAKTAGDKLGIFNTNITACANGKVKTAGKFIWKHKTTNSTNTLSV